MTRVGMDAASVLSGGPRAIAALLKPYALFRQSDEAVLWALWAMACAPHPTFAPQKDV